MRLRWNTQDRPNGKALGYSRVLLFNSDVDFSVIENFFERTLQVDYRVFSKSLQKSIEINSTVNQISLNSV